MMPPAGNLRQLAGVRSASPERAWGFSLMEVMVSLVILSVGLLGIAAQSVSVIRAKTSGTSAKSHYVALTTIMHEYQ